MLEGRVLKLIMWLLARTGWWFKPDFIINELNINSAVTSPAHDEVVPLGSRTSYTIVGYAYAGACLCVT